MHSAAVLQKSIREGFGLTVTEALWKARPVVAGRVGGIVDQIQDGETGLPRRLRRASAPRRAARSSRDPERRARRWRSAGKEHVRRRFLTPRLLRDWLALFNRLLGNDTGEAALGRGRPTRRAPTRSAGTARVSRMAAGAS